MSQIELVIESRRKDLGGFEVGRLLPHAKRRMIGPFVFLDHMGPASFPAGIPKAMDVRPHPHVGLSTLTYLFEGQITHRDSLGFHQEIRPGEVNWMTAGAGITHSERFEHIRAHGGPLHGVQAWVALPAADEDCAPAFDHYGRDVLPTYESGGLWARLVAGKAFGADTPVAVHSPLFYVHWKLTAGTQAQLPAEYPERGAFIVSGAVQIGDETFEAGRLLVFKPGEPVMFTAKPQAEVILLGGEPVGPRLIDWNFVASTQERLDAARERWRSGGFVLPVGDDREWTPYPGDPESAPPAMS